MDLDPQNLARLCDPNVFSSQDAIAIARERARLDSLFTSRLARAVLDGGSPAESQKALRLMEILSAISAPVRVVLISPLLHHPDPRVQSKASLLVAKANQSWRWVQQRMRDPDARVRANALEALWGLSTQEARAIFRQALDDPDNRVVGNALLGLHRASDPSCSEKIIELAADPREEFRGTAIWAMQQINDPAFIPVLSGLLRQGGPESRAKTMRALASVKLAQAGKRRRDELLSGV